MDSNYKCYEKDEYLFKGFIKNRLKLNEKVGIFCSFTYITPNYINLFILNELAKLAKDGYELFVVIWDMNSMTNKHFKRHVVPCLGNETPHKFMDQKLLEVEKILYSLGVEPKKLHLYKSSELWKRMISIKEPNLFLKFYQTLTSMSVIDFKHQHKVSHLIQMPADIFFANFLNILYPEDTDKPIDIVLVGNNKEIIYTKTRQLMYENGIISVEKPVFLLIKDIPYIVYDELVPEWNMPLEDIMGILNKYDMKEEYINALFETILSTKLDVLYYLDQNENIIGTDVKGILNVIKKLSLENKTFTIAYNLYNYMNSFKNNLNEKYLKNNVFRVINKEQAYSLGKLFKSKPLLDIILVADGTKNISQIAKILKKQVTNISLYVNLLKKEGFVNIDSQGKVKRNFDAIKVNLDSDLLCGDLK